MGGLVLGGLTVIPMDSARNWMVCVEKPVLVQLLVVVLAEKCWRSWRLMMFEPRGRRQSEKVWGGSRVVLEVGGDAKQDDEVHEKNDCGTGQLVRGAIGGGVDFGGNHCCLVQKAGIAHPHLLLGGRDHNEDEYGVDHTVVIEHEHIQRTKGITHPEQVALRGSI
eukprot:15359444-Ditylum_brightwellii.AAC.1